MYLKIPKGRFCIQQIRNQSENDDISEEAKVFSYDYLNLIIFHF